MFEPDSKFEAELVKSDEFKLMLWNFANDIKDKATALDRSVEAPWMPRKGRQPIEVRELTDNQGDKATWVINTDHAAAIVEWGSRNNPAYHPLMLGVKAAGLEFHPEPKGGERIVIPN